MLKNNGFSLMELMVTLGIMATVIAIGASHYQSYKAKARQKGGFLLLEIFYVAAIATKVEFKIFPGDFVQTGFQPVGELNYRFRSNVNANNLPGIDDNDCFTTWNNRACDCGGLVPTLKLGVKWQPLKWVVILGHGTVLLGLALGGTTL